MKKRILIVSILVAMALIFLSAINTAENSIIVEPAESIEFVEPDIEFEPWMAEPMNQFMEGPIKIEDWMTHTFTAFVEPPLELENWMTKPFYIN